MDLHKTVDFARNLAVLVRVQGPDPKGLKMRKHAFHQYHSGKTILSASGMLLPHTLYDTEVAKRIWDRDIGQGSVLVLTVASVIEPFLTLQHRENISQGRPELIPGAQIGIMLEGKSGTNTDEVAPSWLAAQLLKMVDVPASSLALQSLFEASSGSTEHGWEVGWSLASSDRSHQPLMDVFQTQTEDAGKPFMERQKPVIGEPSNPNLIGRSITRISVLGVNLFHDPPNIGLSHLNERGEFLLAAGSPFGILSPMHFFNSISVGTVANTFPPKSPNTALLMADIRCLPGMEGGPVFDKHALVGILTRPLRQKNTGAEIQLVIPWEAIATACSDLLLKEPKNAETKTHINQGNLNAVGNEKLSNSHHSNGPCCYNYKQPSSACSTQLSIERAMASVCLITIDNGVWASGVVINNQGLILTNAHLLEPWRFGKTNNGQRTGNKNESPFPPPEESTSSGRNGLNWYQRSQGPQPIALKIGDASMTHEYSGYKLGSCYQGKISIRVHLDHLDPWIWCDAKLIYICKGSLDVALLQLDYVPDQLSPIIVDFGEPFVGSKVHVIGHGLLGPRCALLPSVCSGVVAKVVKTMMPSHYKSLLVGDSEFPAMLETTAAVHPGGSGGAVVNAAGHMIGLVTSNARHSGGTVIPHLNFSIPSAVLAPIFEFARDMQDFSLLQNLDQPNEHLSSVWSLMPPSRPRPGPNLAQSRLEDNNNKEGKGSRFTKFIAERNELLRRPEEPGKEERLPSGKLPSKL
ncbi:hypothetical protein SLE2022_011740 [Rubroshorea leprosula]